MTLTVRTDHRVEQQLAKYAARTQQTKSDVVKQALAEFLEKAFGNSADALGAFERPDPGGGQPAATE